MKIITLGKTNLKVNKNGFGALPIQRISEKEAVYLLHKAYDNGINFYDTARFYTDSEEKIGAAFADRRKKVIIASKTAASWARISCCCAAGKKLSIRCAASAAERV